LKGICSRIIASIFVSTSSLIAVNVQLTSALDDEPSISWSTQEMSIFGRNVTVRAFAETPVEDSERIKKWCLVVDGSPVVTNVAVPTADNDFEDQDLAEAVFDSSTGCWTRFTYFGGVRVQDLKIATFSLTLTAGQHTFVVSAVDTANRLATSKTLTVVVDTSPTPTGRASVTA
jgi:hypothetical protein